MVGFMNFVGMWIILPITLTALAVAIGLFVWSLTWGWRD